MKLLFTILLLVFVFTVSASAQSVKTDDGKHLKEVESLIIQTEKQIKEKDIYLSDLLVKFTSDFIRVKEVRSEISKLNEQLTSLNLEKKELISKQLIKTLPNSQIELLKIIIVQNDKIIDLLEKLQKPFP